MDLRRSCLLLPLLTLLAPLPLVAADDEEARIADALGLCQGMNVADVGAGDGRFSSALARKVGPSGHVYATEVERGKLDEIQARASADRLSNVTAVLGDQDSTGLPAGCCDAILLRMVYHHFTDPPAMRRSLLRALRPGGRIALVEVPPQAGWRRLDGVPERGGHGILKNDLLAEMRGEGFELLARHDSWPGEDGSYCLVFQRRPLQAPADRKPVLAPEAVPATP